jgi:hypothetical protein
MINSSEKSAAKQTTHAPKARQIVRRQHGIVLSYILLTLQKPGQRCFFPFGAAASVYLAEHQR